MENTEKEKEITQNSNGSEDVLVWPSKRIPQGGLFHAPKIEYSKETADLIKVLMEESRMSMLMRKQINQHLRNGEPLPQPTLVPKLKLTEDPDKDAAEILKRARQAKRKSLQAIKASGVYEMTNYRPKPTDKIPSDKAKKLLQEAMAGTTLPETTLKPKRRSKSNNNSDYTDEDFIDELLDQINERANWLAEMEELGEGKKYRDEIREQIAERLRRIQALEIKEKVQKKGIRYVD